MTSKYSQIQILFWNRTTIMDGSIMEKNISSCFLVNRVKYENCEAAVNYVKSQFSVDQGRLCMIKCSDRDFCTVNEGCCFSLQEIYVRLGTALDLFRKNATYLGSDDHLIALQLCIAEVNKQKDGKFDVLASDVLYHKDRMTNARLTNQPLSPDGKDSPINDLYFEFLSNTNTIDPIEAYHLVRKFLEDPTQRDTVLGSVSFMIFDLPENPLQKAMLALLIAKRRVYKVLVETSLDDSLTTADAGIAEDSKIQFQIDEASLEDVLNEAISPCKISKTKSATQLHMERAIMAYFRIIVNSRDEIALATALSSMAQVFSHQAFTALKNKAKAANLSMYQMAVSLITRMKLGGKGYAPDPNSPLMPFLPEISTFTELLGKIQSILEEDLNTKNAIARIIKMVKGHIMKTCNPKLHKNIIELAAEQLKAIAEVVVDQSLLPFCNQEKKSEDNDSVIGQHTINAMRQMVNIHNAVSSFGYKTEVLTDCFTSQSSPIRLPSLISQFRSPDCDEPMQDDPKPLIQRVKSRMMKNRQSSDNFQNVSMATSKTPSDSCCTTTTTPVKVIEVNSQNESTSEKIIEMTDDHENTQTAKNGLQWPHKNVKRALLNTGDDRSAKAKKLKTARKLPKPKPQVKGQQLMTRFLKV